MGLLNFASWLKESIDGWLETVDNLDPSKKLRGTGIGAALNKLNPLHHLTKTHDGEKHQDLAPSARRAADRLSRRIAEIRPFGTDRAKRFDSAAATNGRSGVVARSPDRGATGDAAGSRRSHGAAAAAGSRPCRRIAGRRASRRSSSARATGPRRPSGPSRWKSSARAAGRRRASATRSPPRTATRSCS